MKLKFIRLAGLSLALLLSTASYAWEYKLPLAESLTVIAIDAPFVESKHRLSGCKQSYQNCLIDGVTIVGSIGVPNTMLESISVKIEGTIYSLDTSGMYNALITQDMFPRQFGGYCYDQKNCNFRGVFGDAGGQYAAEWVVRNGKTWRTVLSDNIDVVQFFREHLVAPRYE